jgi:flagellar basal-body rod protein FlgG
MASTGSFRCAHTYAAIALLGGVLFAGSATAAHPKTDSRASRKDSADRDARRTLERALKNYQKMFKVIANNIANADTPGYKRSQVLLVDDEYEEVAEPGEQDASGNFSTAGLSIGAGSRVAGTRVDFRQGRLRHTGGMFDLAIAGEGFFQIKDASGAVYYCRAGRFCLNANGQIVIEATDSSRLLEPAITVPSDATRVVVGVDGTMRWRVPGSSALQEGGTIQLAKFINPQGLRRIGNNLYAESDGSGTAQVGSPGENSFGKLRQGWIEESNVDLEDEIAEWKRVRKTCRALRKLLNEKD